jgi:hypothetical protein
VEIDVVSSECRRFRLAPPAKRRSTVTCCVAEQQHRNGAKVQQEYLVWIPARRYDTPAGTATSSPSWPAMAGPIIDGTILRIDGGTIDIVSSMLLMASPSCVERP